MNYQTLINNIQDNIYNNGNNDITGDLLQQVLISMITGLGAGYQFAGIATAATEPGTPDQRVFYLAGAGTYPNFGQVTIPTGKMGVLYYNSNWNVETITLPVTIEDGAITYQKLDQSLAELITDGYVYIGLAEPTTNPGTPTRRCFYVTTTIGNYTNFGNINVTEDGIIVLKYDGTTWQKDVIVIPVAEIKEQIERLESLIGDVAEVDLSQIPNQNCSLGSNSWYHDTYGLHKAIPVVPGDEVKITMVSYNGHTSGNYNGWYVFVTSSYNPPYSSGAAIPSTGGDKRIAAPVGQTIELSAPSNAAYLIITTQDGAGVYPVWSVEKSIQLDTPIIEQLNTLTRKLSQLSDIVDGHEEQVDGHWGNAQVSVGSLYQRVFFVCDDLAVKNGTVVVRLNNYNQYKVGVVIQDGTAWASPTISDTGWKQSDITKIIQATESGYNIRVTIGKVANEGISIAEALSVLTELRYTYIAGVNGLDDRVQEIEKTLINTPSRLQFDVHNSFTYVGKKIDLTQHAYSVSDIGNIPSVGTSRQGFAVFDKYLFQCHNTNNAIVVFNLETGQSIQTINLTANANNHANSASFGKQYYNSSDPFPCLYVSSEAESKVYVYRITGTEGAFSITLIQTLSYGVGYYYPNLHVDAPNMRGVVVGYKENSWQSASGNKMICCCFDLPDVSSGDTVLSMPYNEFSFPFMYAAQGAFGRYGKLYAAFGNTSEGLQIGGVVVVDYTLKNVESFIDLKAAGNFEPEGVGLWDESLIITTQNGAVKKLMF